MFDSIFIQPQNHDVSYTFVDNNTNIRTFEFDRWSDKKHHRLRFYESKIKSDEVNEMHVSNGYKNLTQFLSYIKKFRDPKTIKKCYILLNHQKSVLHTRGITTAQLLEELVVNIFENATVFYHPYHHYAHAASAYYQAPKHFDMMVLVSLLSGEKNLIHQILMI